MSIVAAENAGLVPCELQLGDSWGGVPGKMSVAAPVKKIRKKSDNKPQSQINKCNNEKRRRELENDTINQLEELLGACLSEVRQPDKNGIVQEAASQIRQVLERRRLGACCSACPPACLPLQHGDVSSTHPAHHSEVSALVEALKHYTTSLGWVLLEINCDGEIECVTENIRDIVHWERAELHRQSIYSYVHHGDHHKLLPILQGAAALGWARAERLRAARTRLLVKPDHTEGKETERYTEVLLSACLVREAENGPSVLCVIRREEEPAPVPGPPPRPLHQLTFKLNTQGKILLMEGASVAGIEGRHLQELLHPSDTSRVTEHLRGAAGAAGAPHALPGPPARLRLAPHLPYIAAHPHSRMFPHNPVTNKGDFVMTTFTVLSEAEITLLESGNNNNAQNPPVGGPLMTSAVVNGNSGPRNGQFPPSPASEPFSFPTSEFDLDYFPHTTWPERSSPSVGFSSFPFSPLTIEEHKLEEKPNISHSGPPTPRTPHTPAASTTPLPPPTAPTPPAPEPDSARLRNLLSKRESPAPTPTPVSEHTAPGTPATPGTTNASSGATPPVTPAGNNLILKGLLNQEDEEEAQRGGQGEGPSPRTPPAHPPRTQGNNMLLRLLNEKSDEEDPEQRNNRNNSRSELLSQLLKEGSGGGAGVQGPDGGTAGGSGGEDLLQLLGLGGQRSALKRKLMQEEQTIKRPHSTDPQQVSSTGSGQSGNTSKLWEKNRMLASLLARRPSALTAPVPLPNPHLNQRPFPRPPLMQHQQQQQQQIQQQRHPLAYHNHNQNQALANLLNNNKGGPGYEMANNNNTNSNSQNTGLSPLQQMLQGGHRSAPATPTAPASSNDYRGGGGVAYMGDMSSDTTLSDILDEVMDIVPETYTQDDSELMNYITSAMASQSGQQTNNNQHHHNSYQVEKMAINRIQESLMQCETVVKSPSSPGVPPAYPNTTQAVTSPWAGRYGPAGPAAAPSPAQQQRQKAQLAQQQAQKARLLQAQQQQLVVGAAGGAGGQQGSPGQGAPVSMDALLNAPTPPNVSLQRTSDAPPYPQPPPPPHYHHHHHHHGSSSGFPGPGPGSQEAPPYKLSLQQQQNPMLNAQLTVLQQSGYSGQRGSPLAPHTPLTPHAGPLSPYPLGPPAPQQHGPPPPRLQRHLSHPSHHPPTMQVGSSGVGGGYYVGGGAAGEAGGGGYPPEQVFLPPPPHLHPHHPHQHHHHANNHMSGMTSEYVRQELRAVVGARTSGGGGAGPGGGGGGARPPDLLNPAPPDLESLGLSFEMPPSGGAGGVVVGGGAPPSQQVTPSNQKLWDAHHNTTPTTMEEVRGGDHKSSLLQKLLSE